MNKIKVLLVEDDPFWIKHIVHDLNQEADIVVAYTADTKEQAVDAALHADIDVVLMDVELNPNQRDGLYATQEITSRTDCKVIMMTSYHERNIILDAFDMGAVNYVTKEHYSDIVDAIRAAHAGHSSIHGCCADVLLIEWRLRFLSRSEREVYDLKEQGFKSHQIASMLHKSLDTVKSQIKSIGRKRTKTLSD
ncbi:response regulator transcription factor [Paenibacillus sp. ACRRX]|uniref:response regulator transcription factor n=1 Tax=unclassified Paenibacillus TaxID=185978 RepID=UPI001EF455E3|nr:MULTISPECIES: response regulator transcription factor [unclassified Paenibacillus]MCG7408919.1 response regulator transcription factor [Paenibacillus sp. ACRRX]MDK8182170.1 response regulator transcription factor [Paenibacillus sp. UMB4589-SE434]